MNGHEHLAGSRLGLNDDRGRQVPPGKVIHALHAGVEALRAPQTPGWVH